jgi:hypothetical protein
MPPYQGSECKLCKETFGVGTHFGTAFLCMPCESWLWDFLRAAKQTIKQKK